MSWECGFEGPGGHFLPADDEGDIGGGGGGEEGASEVEARRASSAVVVLVVDGDLRHAYPAEERDVSTVVPVRDVRFRAHRIGRIPAARRYYPRIRSMLPQGRRCHR